MESNPILSLAFQVTTRSLYSGILDSVDGDNTVISGGILSRIEKELDVSAAERSTRSWAITRIRH